MTVVLNGHTLLTKIDPRDSTRSVSPSYFKEGENFLSITTINNIYEEADGCGTEGDLMYFNLKFTIKY